MGILLNPAGPPRISEAELTPRTFTSLDGLRLGLLGNSKLNADHLLEAVGELLRERYDIAAVVHHTKPSFSLPVPDGTLDEMAESCDVVLAGVGD